jgi:hypothetical protein
MHSDSGKGKGRLRNRLIPQGFVPGLGYATGILVCLYTGLFVYWFETATTNAMTLRTSPTPDVLCPTCTRWTKEDCSKALCQYIPITLKPAPFWEQAWGSHTARLFQTTQWDVKTKMPCFTSSFILHHGNHELFLPSFHIQDRKPCIHEYDDL